MGARSPHRVAIGAALAYALLVLLAHLPTIFPPSDALDGIGVVVLTIPWSILMVLVLSFIDPTLLDHPEVGFVGCLIGAGINVVLIYLGIVWMTRAKSKPNP